MKKLSVLLEGVQAVTTTTISEGAEISAITSDSRQAKPGTVFVAVKGTAQDGHRFIPQVATQGATLIIGEEPAPANDIPYLQVNDSRLALAKLAANFHDNPTHEMMVVGVTGTSGKTTTTYILESILEAAGKKVGVIGTVNFRYGGKVIDSTHTTPGPVELQALIRQMRDGGCDALVMEVSSHALKQHRAAYVAFDGMVFNNLSPEHMDFHPDMEDYYQSKKMLFRESVAVAIAAGKEPFAAINVDDEYGRRLHTELMDEAPVQLRFRSYGLSRNAEVSGVGLRITLGGIQGEAGGISIFSPLTGRFNAFNTLAAVALAQGLGLSPQTIARGIQALPGVPGRIQKVPNDQGIEVFVDYAHKPDALENVLKTLREMLASSSSGGRLITVFGCGGDRDRTKRPVMGKLAVELSDLVFITSDNPRTEDPASIIREILAGTNDRSNFKIEPDRGKAIFEAISVAKAGDVVVIAGKGHEDYQIISDPSAPTKTRKIHFDDREVATEALRSRNQVP